ncbi:hypothetical protein GJ744_000662 [Endocarpon pusillum]|uniref:Dolichyl-diphosphooligosaccharide--protein glycosyltransferase subunit 4 n=1 Tax=Endocarpon pusillum TaxID=364733 RepID=A0A8H7AEF6_9EURO|nr:hypothetical protein GJ744_000662 [Endocarpon pusillum]
MISDSTLYSLSIFLGSLAMLLIILYHYLEVNSHDDDDDDDDDGDNTENTTSRDTVRSADQKMGVGPVKAAPPHSKNTGAGFNKDKGTMAASMNKGGGSS